MIKFILRASAGALALALAFGAQVQAGESETVVMIDAPDIQKIAREHEGFRTTDVISTDVYSNKGKRIGEIEDFLLDRSGNFYAVVDIDDGPLDGLIELGMDESIVVPWRQLRVSSVPSD